MKTPDQSHREAAASGEGSVRGSLGFYVATVSSTRYEAASGGREPPDESGDVAAREIAVGQHRVVERRLISDERGLLEDALAAGLRNGAADVVLFTGGTGVSPRDITIETIRPRLEKELEGFGEIFRAISYKEVGAAAMLTRATAGILQGKLVLCLPGSPNAVATALRLVMKEIPHILYIARKNG
jgi:molybdenum cofactor biosynthesis protein B